jgi:hypothetical protein
MTSAVLDFDPQSPVWLSPRTFRLTVTPELAAQMLDTNKKNRPISWRKVNDHVREMQAGNWRYNPADALCFDTDGVLANGQHRLLAVLDCELAQDFLIATGVEPSVQDVMDNGLVRTTAHQLALSGYNDAKNLSALARVFLLWKNGTITSAMRRPSTVTVKDFLEKTDPQALEFALAQAKRVASATPLRAGIGGAAALAAYQLDPVAAQRFFDELIEGVNLDAHTPTLTLKNYLARHAALRTRFREPHQLWLLVSTWNSWRKGKTLVKIMSPTEWSASTFPDMK